VTERAPPEWLLLLWNQVEARWDDEAAHRAVLAVCDTPERLMLVARHYRALETDPERSVLARRQLDAITALALARLTVPARPPETSKRWKMAWLLLLLAGVVALVLHL
jgi:hypothetical protein